MLHELSKHKRFGVTTFQAEDEIAGVGAALGASFAGHLGVTTTSGPGVALKAETIGLAVMTELPLVICDIQRAGPSTGMPTKTEQADLLQVMFGRNGEAPVPVLAAQSPADCFDTAIEAVRIAVKYRTPVILLSDGYIANGAEPWPVPDLAAIPPIDPEFATEPNGTDRAGNDAFYPTGAIRRPWPGRGPFPAPRAAAPDRRYREGQGHRRRLLRPGQPRRDDADPPGQGRRHRARHPGPRGRRPGRRRGVLVLGWGSTYGPITAAVRRVRKTGRKIAQAHLRHLNPFPANLGEVLRSYDRVIVPEMNLGQLALLLRAKYLVDVHSYSRVRGLPISLSELALDLESEIDELEGGRVPPNG